MESETSKVTPASGVFDEQMEHPSIIIDHMIVIKGSSPTPKDNRRRSPSPSITIEDSIPEKESLEKDSMDSFHESEELKINLNRVGSVPILPLSSAPGNKAYTSSKRRMNPGLISPSKKILSPIARSKMDIVQKISEIEDVNNQLLKGKYIYNSAAFLNSIDQVRMESDQLIKTLRNRLSILEKEKTSLFQEFQKVSKKLDCVTKENQLYRNQLEAQDAKISEDKNLILQQKNACTKLSERYMLVNEALHKLAQTTHAGEEDNSNDKGIKGALRALTHENGKCNKRIKLLEAQQVDDKKIITNLQTQNKSLSEELDAANHWKIMSLKDPKKNKNDGSKQQDNESLKEWIDPRVLKVLDLKNPDFNISTALDLVSRFKAWFKSMHISSASIDHKKIIQHLLSCSCELLSCERVRLFEIDFTKKKMFQGFCEKEEDYVEIPLEKGITGRAATNGRIMNISNAYNDPRFFSAVDAIFGEKTKDILCLPITNQDNIVFAVLQASNSQEKKGFSDIDEIICSLIGMQLGGILAQSKSLDKMSSSQGKLLNILHMPREVSNSFCRSLNQITFVEVVERIELFIDRICGPCKVRLFIIDEQDNKMWFVKREMDSTCKNYPVQQNCQLTSGLCGYVRKTKNTIVIENIDEGARYNDIIDISCGSYGMYILPILAFDQQCIGILEVSRDAKVFDGFSSQDVKSKPRNTHTLAFLDVVTIQISHILQTLFKEKLGRVFYSELREKEFSLIHTIEPTETKKENIQGNTTNLMTKAENPSSIGGKSLKSSLETKENPIQEILYKKERQVEAMALQKEGQKHGKTISSDKSIQENFLDTSSNLSDDVLLSKKRYDSATKIQSWTRGSLIRKNLSQQSATNSSFGHAQAVVLIQSGNQNVRGRGRGRGGLRGGRDVEGRGRKEPGGRGLDKRRGQGRGRRGRITSVTPTRPQNPAPDDIDTKTLKVQSFFHSTKESNELNEEKLQKSSRNLKTSNELKSLQKEDDIKNIDYSNGSNTETFVEKNPNEIVHSKIKSKQIDSTEDYELGKQPDLKNKTDATKKSVEIEKVVDARKETSEDKGESCDLEKTKSENDKEKIDLNDKELPEESLNTVGDAAFTLNGSAPSSTTDAINVGHNELEVEEQNDHLDITNPVEISFKKQDESCIDKKNDQDMEGNDDTVQKAKDTEIITEIEEKAIPEVKTELPENWMKATDDEGNVYYYNMVTNETTWEIPTEKSTPLMRGEMKPSKGKISL